MMNRCAKASVRDVAQAAGVSIGSVSRVLNGGAHVSMALRARVMAAAEQLDYQANVHARGLRLNASRIIGCMVPELRNPIYGKIIESLEAAVTHREYMLLLGNSRAEVSREAQLLRFFQSHGVDGLVLTPNEEGQAFIEGVLGRCRLPMVVIDRDVQGSRDCVMLDHRAGVQRATEYLLSLGHRRIALFSGGYGFWSGRERVSGYAEAFRLAGFVPVLELIHQVHSGSYTVQMAKQTMMEILQLPIERRPTAIIAPGTHILAGALQAVRERGLRIPQDFSVIAIGASDAVEFSSPALTVVRWDAAAHATQAVELLFERLAHPDALSQQRMVATELVLGQSCAPML